MTNNANRELAESWGRVVGEIVLKRKHKLWSRVLPTPDEELDYIAWAARWAFHWAAQA